VTLTRLTKAQIRDGRNGADLDALTKRQRAETHMTSSLPRADPRRVWGARIRFSRGEAVFLDQAFEPVPALDLFERGDGDELGGRLPS
jgi:hypothetical protein